MEETTLRQEADRRFDLMLDERREWEPWWKRLRRQYAPNRGRFSVDERPYQGQQRLNSRCRQIPDDFAAGIKSGLTSPSRPWFTLTTYDRGLNESESVRAWLSSVQDIMQNQMLRTNLYDQLFDVYKEEGIFGTAALFIEEDDEPGKCFTTRSLTVGSYVIGVDDRGRVCRFGRQYKRTARQLADEFGEEALPRELRARLRERPDRETYELRNLIEPSEDFRRTEGAWGEFRFRSMWWLKGFTEPAFLKKKGYHEFPVMVPRWRIIGDDLYGREQPGDLGLDDARSIQDLEKDIRRAIKKAVDPALLAPMHMREEDVRDEPGGVTFYNAQMGKPEVGLLYPPVFDYQGVAAKQAEVIQHLEQLFAIDLFKMWSTDQRQGRTATEIEAREAEKMFMLGPMVERQMSELLGPMIERIFGVMERDGKFPPPPEEMEGQEIKVEYMSILANIQKQASYSGIQLLLQTAGTLAQLQTAGGQRPEVLDKLDADEIIDQLQDMYILPAGIVNGDDKVATLRQERNEAEAQARREAQLMEEMKTAAQAAPQATRAIQDLSQTPMPGGGNGLETMAGMMGGQGGQAA